MRSALLHTSCLLLFASSMFLYEAQASEVWIPIVTSGPAPSPRRELSSAYDPLNDRMIIFGGVAGGADTWALALGGTPAWTNLSPLHAPSARRDHSMVYDPLRHRILLFGGEDIAYRNDIWALDLRSTPAWEELIPGGTPPGGRLLATVVYDPPRDRLLVFGGYDGGPLGDVWVLSLSEPMSWTRLAPLGPAPAARWSSVGIYDPNADRMVIAFGTTSAGYNLTSEVWGLSLGGTPTWSQLSPAGESPPARALSAAVYDEAHQRMIVYGGYRGSDSPLDDVWALEFLGGPSWTRLTPQDTPPPPRWSHTAVYRTPTQQMFVFGGWNSTNYLGDSWALNLGSLPVGPPTITGFFPAGGRIGDEVTILGSNLSDATEVSFNEVDASILERTYSRIRTQVPPGATTGPITVVNPHGSASSTEEFFVGEAPVITSAVPDSGKVGTTVEIHGENFTAATRVSFGSSTSDADFTVIDDALIQAIVDTSAMTGHILVTTLAAMGSSDFDFRVIPLDPRPRIVAVRDVPADQGGRVVLAWDASDFDKPWRRVITGYRVWRRARIAVGPAVTESSDPLGAGTPLEEQGIGASVYWESIAELPAAFLEGYAYVAATLQDSTAQENPYTAFFVQALTEDAFTFYNSTVDSGYSVDNLSPPLPVPFAATYAASGNTLHWSKNRAPDLKEFRLHRGSASDFVPGPSNLLVALRDTTYRDEAGAFFYKLAAVDIHGNLSRFASVGPEIPTANLATVVRAEGLADRVRLLWYVGSPSLSAAVYRRTADTDWKVRSMMTTNGSGYLAYEDHDVITGTRYDYRLGIEDGGEEIFAGEVWVVAEAPVFTLGKVSPNPAPGGAFVVEFVLSSVAPASLEFFDVAGRCAERIEVGGLGPGRHAVKIPAQGKPLPAGIYLVRLRQGKEQRTTRLAVLN